MKVGSYTNRIQVMLDTDEWVQLGRPEAIDIEFLNNGHGFLAARNGKTYRRYRLDDDHAGGMPFVTSTPRPMSVPVFGLQTLLSHMDKGALVARQPNLSIKPVVRRKGARHETKSADTLALQGKPKVVPLEDALFSINAHKRARPKEIELTLDDQGFLGLHLRLGR